MQIFFTTPRLIGINLQNQIKNCTRKVSSVSGIHKRYQSLIKTKYKNSLDIKVMQNIKFANYFVVVVFDTM